MHRYRRLMAAIIVGFLIFTLLVGFSLYYIKL